MSTDTIFLFLFPLHFSIQADFDRFVFVKVVKCDLFISYSILKVENHSLENHSVFFLILATHFEWSLKIYFRCCFQFSNLFELLDSNQSKHLELEWNIECNTE